MRSVRRARAVAAIAVVCGLGIGCTADHSGSGPSNRYMPGTAPAATAGTSGGAGANASGTAGGFNNSSTNPQQSSAQPNPIADGGIPVSDGSSCLIGKFCASDNPDKGCGMLTLASTVKMTMEPGNLLIIFDQSQSMQEMWQMTTKLEAAKQALVAAIMPLQDSLTVGAIFLPYPDAPAACLMDPNAAVVQPIDGTGNIPFMPAAQFIQQFNSHWSMNGTGNGFGTPLNEAFDRASVALDAALPKLTGHVAVMVFTDGMPNCNPNPMNTMIPTKSEPTRAADWLAKGVVTYMIGLPGADGVQYLNDIAVNGGSGMYLTPDDPTMLADQLKQLIQQQVSSGFDSCSIDLMPPTATPDKLQLIVEEQGMAGVLESVPRDLGSAGGWKIDDKGSHVELVGSLCDAAMSGKFSRLTFEFGCKDVPPIMPSHVM